jgi:tetratricopeptide (TPR) repeat protein
MVTIKNRVGKNFIFLVTMAIALAGCKPPGPRALLEGKKLMERGHYPEAVEKLKSAASLLPTNALAWDYLGLACQYAGQATNAAQAYQKALTLNPDLLEARYNLGCLWLEQGKPDAARAELTTYTSLRGNDPEGWLRLGDAQLRLAQQSAPGDAQLRSRELIAAEKSFSEALHLSPQNPEALNGLGLVQQQRNHSREAAQYFSAALKHQPNYAPALLNLAIVSHVYLSNRPFALQKYREYLVLASNAPNAEAVHALVRSLEQEPAVASHPPAISNTVAQLNNTAKPQATNPPNKVSSPAVAAKAPVTPEPTSEVAVARVAPEPVIKPAQDVASASSQTKSNEPAAAAPATVVAEEPRTAKGGFLQKINPINLFRRQPAPASNPAALPSNTVAVASAKSVPAAASPPATFARYHYQSPAKPSPGSDHLDAERAFAQGVQAQQASRLQEAMTDYRKATQLDPAYFDAYYNYGLAATDAHNYQAALIAYEVALAIRPESLEARYNFALVLQRSGYPIDAANELEKLLTIYPNYGRGHLALGNLFAQELKQPAKAREHYQKALETDPHNPQADAVREWLAANPP